MADLLLPACVAYSPPMAETESGKKKYGIGVAIAVTGFVITTYLIPWLRDNLFLPVVHGIRDFFVWLGHYLATSVTIPCWLLWILVILAGIVVSGNVRAARRRKAEAASQSLPQPLHWKMFTELIYEGVKWT